MKYASLLAAGTIAASIQVAVAAPASVTTVMSYLDNPRGLAFDARGALYVAEAGRGGAGPCAVVRGLPRCYGPTGAVSRLWRGQQIRVATGLPSYTDADDAEVTGPEDVSFNGGRMTVSIGFGDNPALRAGFGPVGAQFGTLIRMSAGGDPWRVAADVAAHEAADNPAGGPIDSNPYGLLTESHDTLVADAGANALLRVTPRGQVSTIVTFPSRPARATDAVPTSVVRGPDGAYYVGELTGAPFADGAANIWRVVPGSAPQVFASGLKTIIDLDFDADGNLYVLQHATGPIFFSGPGQIVRITPNGDRSVVYSGLERPTSLAVGPDGALYVSIRGVSILTGEVWRIEL